MVLTFEFVDEILQCDQSVKATEQYFPLVLFIMLYKVQLYSTVSFLACFYFSIRSAKCNRVTCFTTHICFVRCA